LDQAVSGAAGKLEKTLERTLGRKTSILMRNLGKRAELAAASPLLEQEAAAGKREDFTELLRPLLSHLAEHARRELRIMEASGAAHAGQHTVDDLLDELVTRAWIQFADRPRSMAFDLWLAKILDEILEEPIHRTGGRKLSLDERSHQATPSDVPQVDDQEWWIWLLGEDEVTTPAEGLVGRQSAWAEKFLEAEELIHRIDFLLGSVPKLERQAFVLKVLEGYELYEIAMIQDRPESAILADVQAARDYLREQLGASCRSAGAAASPVSLVANQ
jgi:DNA-directed RNA polymerase specialized sigma24 family protein